MKNYTLRTIGKNDEVLYEDQIVLEEKDVIILEVPDGVNAEIAGNFHRVVKESLEKNNSVITIACGIKMKVLKIK